MKNRILYIGSKGAYSNRTFDDIDNHYQDMDVIYYNENGIERIKESERECIDNQLEYAIVIERALQDSYSPMDVGKVVLVPDGTTTYLQLNTIMQTICAKFQ